MRPVSERFVRALQSSYKRATEVTCTVPGGSPVEIGKSAKLPSGRPGPGWASGSVTCSNATGVRYAATLEIVPAPGFDTYGMVSTPGAIFHIRAGVDYGAGDVELADCGVYELASAPSHNILEGGISLTLGDQWQRVERSRFTNPHAPGASTRAAAIADAVTGAIPTASVSTLDDGGSIAAGNVWDRDRAQCITDLARDGSLDAAFDAAGVFVIRTEPILNPANTVALFRTGEASNIMTADRQRPFDRLYNTVIVVPVDESQTWARQTVTLDDPNHPRHPDKIGVVPYFYSSPTLMTAAAAAAAGATILQRVLGTTELVNLGVLGNPALEAGDAITIAHEPTETDPGFQAVHMIDSWQMDLAGGEMALATRSSTLAQLEES